MPGQSFSKYYFLFSLMATLIMPACEYEVEYIKNEKMFIHNLITQKINKLDETMRFLRGDLLQSAIDTDIKKLVYLQKLENLRHSLALRLNKLRFVTPADWEDFNKAVKFDLKKAEKQLNNSDAFH